MLMLSQRHRTIKNKNHGPQKLSRKAGVFDVSLCCSSEQPVPRHNIYFEKASAWLWGLGYNTHKSQWHSGLQHLSLLFITKFTHLRWVGELSLWAWPLDLNKEKCPHWKGLRKYSAQFSCFTHKETEAQVSGPTLTFSLPIWGQLIPPWRLFLILPPWG